MAAEPPFCWLAEGDGVLEGCWAAVLLLRMERMPSAAGLCGPEEKQRVHVLPAYSEGLSGNRMTGMLAGATWVLSPRRW